jgi:predicted alpha/beta superfamily hydrolase
LNDFILQSAPDAQTPVSPPSASHTIGFDKSGTESSALPLRPLQDFASPAHDPRFEPLAPGEGPASDLDANPRFLRLHGFRSSFLPGQRDIVVYLPAMYLNDPARRFPVFYLHDGQNLMDGRTSYVAYHTWRAHTTADALAESGEIEPIILVGIDNTGVRRMAEYTPTRDPRLGGGAGEIYARLLIEELKPLIDSTFRTLPDAADTALGGSSLGGLISLALGLTHPDVFGRIAALSPSVWWNQRSILNLVRDARPNPRPRIWLDMGTAEGLRHLRDTDLLHHRLQVRGWKEGVDLTYLRVPDARHEEDAWAARFDKVLRFLFPPRLS